VIESCDELRWDVEEIRDGGEWILAIGHIRGQGHDSEVAIDARAGWLAHFNEGRIVRFQMFAIATRPSKPVGLRE
jgi:hypothetical protein